MRVLLYRGKSMVSKAIRWQTRSKYSHAAIQLNDGSVIEAWHTSGVRHIRYPGSGHTKRTPIDCYRLDITSDCDIDKVEQFLTSQLGKRYAFSDVFRFMSRRKTRSNEKWFCSELVLAALSEGGVQLLNITPSEASPRDVSISPKLFYEETIGEA